MFAIRKMAYLNLVGIQQFTIRYWDHQECCYICYTLCGLGCYKLHLSGVTFETFYFIISLAGPDVCVLSSILIFMVYIYYSIYYLMIDPFVELCVLGREFLCWHLDDLIRRHNNGDRFPGKNSLSISRSIFCQFYINPHLAHTLGRDTVTRYHQPNESWHCCRTDAWCLMVILTIIHQWSNARADHSPAWAWERERAASLLLFLAEQWCR